MFSVAQSSLIDRLHTMQKNPRLKEKVYIHTNKTSYFPDDVIWFKAYVGDSINYPSVRTHKLNVNLIDLEGKVIFSRKILIEDGVGSGQLELNEAIASGMYYLQARTNYMRNFSDDYQYLQEIKILGQRLPKNSRENIKYDVQLLPEGGNLIECIDNVLGIKSTKNGQNIDFKGSIINKHGELVTTFQSEHAGMSSCRFIYEKEENYIAKIMLQDTLIHLALPPALPQGVSLQVDNSNEDKLKVYLKTNEATFYNQTYSNYTLLYHQDRQIFDLVTVARLDSLTGLIETNKSIFLDGVHTITLFADDKPIAERKLYIETNRKKSVVTVEKSKIENDSITYKLFLRGKNKNLVADLSISILMESSMLLNEKNTIQSAYLLSPYVMGNIENPAYYFNAKNKKRKEHLDLLLLTQGWTQYTLDELIQKINPTENYKFEKGFKLEGRIQEKVKYKNIALIPNDFRIIDKVNLRDKSEFSFSNLKVFKGDTVRIAYQNWLGKIIKPSQIVFDTIEIKGNENYSIPKRYPEQNGQLYSNDAPTKFLKNTANNSIEEMTIPRNPDGTIALDEVVVSKKKRNKSYFRRRKIIEKYKPIVQDIGRYVEVPIQEVFRNYEHDLISFLNANGARLNDTNPMDAYIEHSSRQEALLVIDGRLVYPSELLSITSLSMKNISNVMVTERAIIEGKIYLGIVYQIFTTDEYQKNATQLFDKFIINNGYDRTKKYYTPLYTFNKSRPINLLEVDWKPFLKTNSKGEAVFKISNNKESKGFLMSIQGFSNEGHLISETIKHE